MLQTSQKVFHTQHQNKTFEIGNTNKVNNGQERFDFFHLTGIDNLIAKINLSSDSSARKDSNHFINKKNFDKTKERMNSRRRQTDNGLKI